MQAALLLATILAVSTWGHTVRGHEYLKDPPSFLKACHIHGSDVDVCFSKVIETIFTKWKDGVPGLKNLSPLDPFHVKKLRIAQQTNGGDIQVELKNVVAHGMSNNKVLKSSINEKDYTFKFHMLLPALKIESDYKVKGRILVLNLDGHGTSITQITDMDYMITAKTKLKKIDDEYFFDVEAITSEIKGIGSFHLEFTNLFNGNKDLEDAAHQLFNENWRQVFDILRPAIAQTLDSVVLDRYKRIFNYVPARFFIADLP